MCNTTNTGEEFSKYLMYYCKQDGQGGLRENPVGLITEGGVNYHKIYSGLDTSILFKDVQHLTETYIEYMGLSGSTQIPATKADSLCEEAYLEFMRNLIMERYHPYSCKHFDICNDIDIPDRYSNIEAEYILIRYNFKRNYSKLEALNPVMVETELAIIKKDGGLDVVNALTSKGANHLTASSINVSAWLIPLVENERCNLKGAA